MKKLFFYSLLTGSLGLNLYLLNSETVVKNDLDSDQIIEKLDDEVSIAQSALKIEKPKKSQHKKNIKNIREDFLPEKSDKTSGEQNVNNEKTPEENFDMDYEESRNIWKEKAREYLEVELRLPAEDIDTYFNIQTEREKAIGEFMAPKFENMNPEEPYFLTVEDNVAMGKINEFYLSKLKEQMGKGAYKDLNTFRQKYNQKMIKEGKGHHFIEF